MSFREKHPRLTNWAELEGALADLEGDKTRTIDTSEMTSMLKYRIRGQDEVIKEVVSTLNLRWRQKKRQFPVARFVFAGPTGTGKSELAKAISDYLYGEDTVLRIDCNHLKEQQSIGDLVGRSSVFQNAQPGRLTKPLIDNPRRVVVFEEIEKAHPEVCDLFLSEGRATDQNLLRDADFTQAIFILTSNAEQAEIVKIAAEAPDLEQRSTRIRRHLSDRKVFRPEIAARFDEIFVFQPLSNIVVAEIAIMRLYELADSYGLQLESVDSTLIVDVTKSIIKGREFGAREAPRIVERMFGSGLLDAKDQGAERIRLSIDPEGNLRIDPA